MEKALGAPQDLDELQGLDEPRDLDAPQGQVVQGNLVVQGAPVESEMGLLSLVEKMQELVAG